MGLSAQDVFDLGGNESDIELMRGVDSDSDNNVKKESQSKTVKRTKKKSTISNLDETNDALSKVDTPADGLVDSGILSELKKLIGEEKEVPTISEPRSIKVAIKKKPVAKKAVIIAKPAPIVKSSRNVPATVGKLIFESNENWHGVELPTLDASTLPSDEQIRILMEKAGDLYTKQCGIHKALKSRSKHDSDFVSTILRSGTLTDKVSALSLLIQESPLYSFELMSGALMGMAASKSRRENVLAIDSIKDLMVSTILPDRKLRFFRDQQGLADPNITDRHLLLFYYEEEVKKCYAAFIMIVQELSKDPLLHVKNKMCIYLSDLLLSKPEQESALLSLLVNKLGDQEKKISSKIVHLLSLLLQSHPNMKLVVIKETMQVLFRSNITQRTQYYAITFLNQIVLARGNADGKSGDVLAANMLVDIYFRIFGGLVAKIKGGGKGDVAEPKNPDAKKGGKKGAAKKALPKAIVVDGIDAKMMSALLTGINRAFPYSKLDAEVFNTHINMLFTLTHIGTFSTCIQSLTLLNQIQQNHPAITDRYYRALYQTLLDKRLLTASKQSLYLNLLYKSLKNDASINRIRAFVKRMLQICGYVGIPFVCASLYLVGMIARTHTGIWAMVQVGEDGDEEVFADAIDEDDLDDEKTAVTALKQESPQAPKYDGLKRDPLFCNAESTCLWELLPFASHFHPTVQLYATTLLNGHPITPPANAKNYDPLQNHTLGRFLDRFVYKNPKKMRQATAAGSKGSSYMQPQGLKSDDMFLVGGAKKKAGICDGVTFDDAPVNTAAWKSQKDVPVDEYFSDKHDKNTGGKVEKADGDDGTVSQADSDEAGEEEVWKAIRKSSGFPEELKEDAGSDGEEDWDAVDDADNLLSDIASQDSNNNESHDSDGGQMEGWAEGQDADVAAHDARSEDNESSDEDDLAHMMVDSDASDTDSSKPKKPVRGKRAMMKMSERAKKLGFTGDYFDRMLKRKKDEDDGDHDDGLFASVDDFESIIAVEESGSGNEETGLPRSRKRKSVKSWAGRKSVKTGHVPPPGNLCSA